MNAHERSSHPLTPMQRGMLLHHLEDAHRGTEILQVIGEIAETLDRPRFEAAWNAVFSAHDAFSLEFKWTTGEETQSIRKTAAMPIAWHDWSPKDDERKESAWRELLERDRRQGFALDHAPLTRLTIVRFSPGSTRILWTHHHIILDGRSELPILLEVFAAYDRGIAPSPRDRRFVDCVEKILDQDEASVDARIDEIFADFATPTPLPFDRTASAAPSTYQEIEDSLGSAKKAAECAARFGVGESTIVLAAWAMTLSRLISADDVLFGEVRSGRYFDDRNANDLIGNFINTLPARARISSETTVKDLLHALRDASRKNRTFEHMPLYSVLRRIGRHSAEPLFESVVVYDGYLLQEELERHSDAFASRRFRLIDQPSVPLALYAYRSNERLFRLVWDGSRISREHAETIAGTFRRAVEIIFESSPESRVVELEPLPRPLIERELSASFGQKIPIDENETVIDAFRSAAARFPDRTALIDGFGTLSFRELDRRVGVFRGKLAAVGAGRGARVGVMLDRTNDLVVTILSVLSLGAAYVPLDPDYPRARLEEIAADADPVVIVTRRTIVDHIGDFGVRTLLLDSSDDAPSIDSTDRPRPIDCAYILFTSGSTGRPKGVVVRHDNVVNFFAGLDLLLPGDESDRWLAVTSLSFDIAGVELLWTLCRGKCVALAGAPRTFFGGAERAPEERAPDFSLFYFAGSEDAAGRGKYDLLFDGARFADRAGFKAVWTPERHFHDFGGLYPNPAVVGAAIAALTKSIEVRAGSVVMPLQDPLRVAEEWSVVDNFSSGRVGISFASGWHADDFVLAPDDFADRVRVMYRDIDVVKRLWRGESIERKNGAGDTIAVGIHPRPVQKELPVWITSGGHPDTFRSAGQMGAHLLTHLLGQELDDLERKIALYREARAAAGHDPKRGCVTLMLHTFVGQTRESVRRAVKDPLIAYLSTSADLVKKLAKTLEHSPESGKLDDAAMQEFLERRFDRYFERCGLFGTPDECVEIVRKLTAIGVDEISCLVDFGIPDELVRASFPLLEEVFRRTRRRPRKEADRSIAEWIEEFDITHIQTTPSLAGMMLADDRTRLAVARLKTFLIGGEALTSTLVGDLRRATGARIFNMYGPTETTIWSTATEVDRTDSAIVSIGRPLANQSARIVDRFQRPVPSGEIGEILIGGRGVTDGYRNRPELTAERFPIDREAMTDDGRPARAYRTGDRGRRRPDGAIDFLGRNDFQIKFRGHRIELGEIEAAIASLPSIARAVVLFRDEEPRLVGYVERRPGATIGEKDIAERIAQRLAAIMVPQAFVFVSEWPLTPNKKVDRRALPAPIVGVERTVEEFRGDVETRLGVIWRRVLNVASFGPTDNYFDLGGHSLLAIQLLAEVRREFAVKLSLADLFAAPTVRSQKAIIEERLLAQASDADLAALLEDLEGLSDEEVLRRLEDRS